MGWQKYKDLEKEKQFLYQFYRGDIIKALYECSFKGETADKTLAARILLQKLC